MTNLQDCHRLLRTTGIIKLLDQAGSAAPEFYLVGGALRDTLLGSRLKDLDFVSSGDPTALARQFSTHIKGHWFWLDEERRYSRVVFSLQGQKMISDFTPFRGSGLDEDLALRDFTINAMALRLNSLSHELIDPLGGQGDLQLRRLRHCSEASFEDDPLRILRGVRISLQNDFSIDQQTRKLMLASAPRIDQVAAERITSELVLALGTGRLVEFSDLLLATGLAEVFFAKGPSSVPQFDAEWLAHGELLLSQAQSSRPAISELLEYNLGSDISRAVLLRLFLLLSGWKEGELIPGFLSLPGKCRRLLVKMFKVLAGQPDWHSSWRVSERSSLRRLEGWGPDPATVLILHWVLCGGPLSALAELENLLEVFNRQAPAGRLQELVSSDWLGANLSLDDGPAMGRIYRQLHEAELSGEVQTTLEAENFLRNLAQKGVDKG